MNKLKNQVFVVIFLILTLFTTIVFCTFNTIIYKQQFSMIERTLNQASKMHFRMDMPPGGFNRDNTENDDIEDIRFMETTVYTVLLDSDDRIVKIINHSDNGVSDEEIEDLAVTMISQSYQKSIGNLYFSTYSYSYNEGSSIVIVDNSEQSSMLRLTLMFSLLMYFLIEAIIIVITKMLTLWITKPVAESFDKQKQFIADASHELKTPLSVIIASADALESNPTEKKWLSNIKSESDRMNRLIADLLELAKSEEVKDTSDFAIGNLSKLVEKSTLTFEGILFEKGVMLNDDIQENIELNMNEFKIQQLMSILLDNAVKHSENGSSVEVTLKKDKDIILTVTNEGEGIPKGEEEKIFERFYRADESRNRNENRYGLGLAIAKNICQTHKATISAKSENGKTTFKVVFKN
ncbi:MAG: HAMP domain-containing histidine kinase [Eubacterium sp.]|nr:HAMP domain-containing histidine kinase [Eubacterium sp.]